MQYSCRIIIAGGRDFRDAQMLSEQVEAWIKSFTPRPAFSSIQIVSGKCSEGADKIGEDWAAKYNIPVAEFPADWATFGASAGPRRNRDMALYATHCICFWDGKSRGTKNMIKEATSVGIPLKVVRYN